MQFKIQDDINQSLDSKRIRLGLRKIPIENPGIVVIFIFVILLFTILSRNFLTLGNLTNILIQNADIAIIAIGQTFVIITAGIDVSVGTSVVVSSYITGILISAGYNVVLSIIAGLLIGILIGLINGLVVTKLKVTPFITTLGMMSIGRGLVYVYSQGIPISGLKNPAFTWLANGKIVFIPTPIVLVFIVGLLAYILLNNMKIGRHVYALGCNEEAAKLAGISITKTIVFVYVMAGLLASLSGMLLTARLSSATASLGSGMEMTSIAAVVLGGSSLSGGKGGVIGSVIGAYLMACLANGFVLLGVNPYWQTVVTGAIIILAVAMDQIRQKSNS